MNGDFEIISVTKPEKEKETLLISSEIYREIIDEIENPIPGELEFLLFSSPNSLIIDTICPVGTRREKAASVFYTPNPNIPDSNNIFSSIQSFQERGYRLRADFHRHPAEIGEQMKNNGKDSSSITCPSLGDMYPLPENIKRDFGIDLVRVIGGKFKAIKSLGNQQRKKSPKAKYLFFLISQMMI